MGQRWARSTYGPGELDVETLLWDVRRFLDPGGLGVDRAVIQLEVRIPEAARRTFWIKVDPDGVDLCMVDPVRPVDAVVDADLRSLTRVWMGDLDFDTAVSGGEIVVLGPPR